MPKPLDPSRYPLAFAQALQHTITTAPEPFFIPHLNPAALRSEFYGYFRALRRTGDSALADAIIIYLRHNPAGLEFRTRDTTSSADAVTAALTAAKATPLFPTISAYNPQDPQLFDFEPDEPSNLPSA